MTERERFIEDWMEIGRTFLPEVPEEEMLRRVLAEADKHFASLTDARIDVKL